MPVECQILGSAAAISAVEGDWRDLWHRDPEAVIFQSFDWVTIWIKHYSHLVEHLIVIACWSDGRLVGLAPLYQRVTSIPIVSPRTVLFTGTGEPECEESFAEYMAPLYRPGWEDRCADAIAIALWTRCSIARLELHRVRLGKVSSLVAAFARQSGCSLGEVSDGLCYTMPAGIDDAFAQMSSSQRGGLRRKLRKLQALDGVSLEVAESEAQRGVYFAQLVDLHQKRWNAQGRPGVFASETFRSFHDALSARLLQKQQLLLARLLIGERLVAVVYGFIGKDAMHYYQGAVDDQLHGALSPGLLLHLLLAEEMGKVGIGDYDLMLSARPDYKARIAQPKEALHTLTINCRSADKLRDSGFAIFRRLLRENKSRTDNG